nr:hypothetical protein [Desulfuromonadales bacterium]
MVKELFTEHPASVDETYTEHMAQAAGFGARMFVASLACFVHALLPFLFERTGSKAISELHTRMVTHRNRKNPAANTAASSSVDGALSTGR